MAPRRAAVDNLAALCDFVAGSSLRQIARRYRWTVHKTEALIRHGFVTYGFGPGAIARRPALERPLRVIARIRPPKT